MNRNRLSWLKWAATLAAGATMLQANGCVDGTDFLTSTASVLTAGGVLFLVFRVLSD